MDLATLTDEDLDALRVAVLTEQERRRAGGERQAFERTVTPGAGDTVIDVDLLPNGVAATPTVVAEWEAARSDALAALDALAATKVEQVTLTGDLAYTLPSTVEPNRVGVS